MLFGSSASTIMVHIRSSKELLSFMQKLFHVINVKLSMHTKKA
jgi:hypothetical protein